jgi:hypothetical protein
VAGEEVRVTVSAGASEETVALFVPQLPARWCLPIYPAELGDGVRRDTDGLLESLTMGTSPRFVGGPAGGTGAPGSAVRGVCVGELGGQATDAILPFLKGLLQVRHRALTSRPWFLIALVLFALSVAARALRRRGAITSGE